MGGAAAGGAASHQNSNLNQFNSTQLNSVQVRNEFLAPLWHIGSPKAVRMKLKPLGMWRPSSQLRLPTASMEVHGYRLPAVKVVSYQNHAF